MEIIGVGGYEEVGRNMTLFRSGEDAIIIDMGIRLDRVFIHEDTDLNRLSHKELAEKGIIPDDSVIKSFRSKIKAIVLSHGHLDHLGAVSIIAKKYPSAPIIGTPYTIELVKKEFRGKCQNPIYTLVAGEVLQVSRDMSIEFVKVTHSIPDVVALVVHSNEGKFLYMNDFKLDDNPILGEPPDYARLKELGKEGVKLMVIETTRVAREGRTPSESIARYLLKDTIKKSDSDAGLIVTTFSSHIARIQSAVDSAKEQDRIPVLLGRSMEKYVGIAERTGIISLPDNVRIYGAQKSITKVLNKIAKGGREEYMLIITGHQGEPDALLSKIVKHKYDFRIDKGDNVVFSADIIPNPINVAQRYTLETKLNMQGARIFKGAHVSGHAAREDHRDIIKMVRPENIVPTHGTLEMLAIYAELAESEGYTLNKNLFLIRNGQRVEVR
ncbi:putative ribonuclease J [archaeon BMS3Bbin15]|nr:putative ribonuclease J [archaeon BMS3Bbin15]